MTIYNIDCNHYIPLRGLGYFPEENKEDWEIEKDILGMCFTKKEDAESFIEKCEANNFEEMRKKYSYSDPIEYWEFDIFTFKLDEEVIYFN